MNRRENCIFAFCTLGLFVFIFAWTLTAAATFYWSGLTMYGCKKFTCWTQNIDGKCIVKFPNNTAGCQLSASWCNEIYPVCWEKQTYTCPQKKCENEEASTWVNVCIVMLFACGLSCAIYLVAYFKMSGIIVKRRGYMPGQAGQDNNSAEEA